MAKYKVLVLSLGGLRNKVYSAGDTVLDTSFTPGAVAKLIENKAIELIEEIEEVKPEIIGEKVAEIIEEKPKKKGTKKTK